jgi:hypothetical protein
VNPQSRTDTGVAMNFIVTADALVGATTINISPAIVTSGAFQNVSASPTTGQPYVIVGAASTAYKANIGFHKDAFTFATADLIMPQGVDFAAREVMDGISMRIVRQYTINNDSIPTRLDVLYGWAPLYQELACRVAA